MYWDQPFLIYVICLSYALQISVKLGSKLDQKLTTFPTLGAPAPTELQFSIIFFNWYVANQETNKSVPTTFFPLNIFRIMSFWLFSWKLHFQNSSNYCYKKMDNSLLVLCSSLLEMYVQSLKLIVWAVFVLELAMALTTQKRFPNEIALTMKTAIPNSF